MGRGLGPVPSFSSLDLVYPSGTTPCLSLTTSPSGFGLLSDRLYGIVPASLSSTILSQS
jgi:hypothetical protein